MAFDSQSPDFEDPFAGSSLLSFLPRKLGVPLHAGAPQSEEQEMKSIQNFLDCFILRGSKTVLEQAQAICNSSQEVVDSSREEKMISPGGKDRLLGRRPALGRKRPRFSLKPISSTSIPDVDFNSQIDQLDDPEEYFKAFDQHENAEKELKKLRGEIPNEYANDQHITVPKRRPGILGKTASFKHQSSAMVMLSSPQDLDKFATSSEVSINPKLNERSNHISSGQAFNKDSIEQNNRVSVATEQDSDGGNENIGNNLLEKLLCSFNDLDDAEGTALLKESLHIKSIEVGKICLPKLDNIQKVENKALKDEVVKKRLEACQFKQKLPTIGACSFAAISNLLRRNSVNDLMESPYLNFPSDGAQDGRDFSPTSCQQKRSLSPSAELEVSCPDSNSLDTSMSTMSDGTSPCLVDKLHNSVTKTDKINDDSIVSKEDETESELQLDENTTGHRHCEMTEEQSTSEGFKKQIKDQAEHIQLDQLSDEPDPGVGGLASCCINNNGLPSTLEITDEDRMLSGKDNAEACGIVDISQTQVNVGTNVESRFVSDATSPCLVDKLHNSVTKTDKINDDSIVSEEDETESELQLDENTTGHRHCEMTEEQSTSEGFKKQIKDQVEHIQLDQLSDEPDPGVGGLASCCINNNGLPSTLEITDEDRMLSGKVNAEACGIVDISQTQVNVGTNVESSAGSSKENSTHQTSVLTFDEQHKGVNISACKDVEKHGYATSGISQNSRKSQKTPSRSKNKNEQKWVSKRKSLAGAGTKFESGLRRSTRKHFRPLQYWCGERFLYGRIHDSLATVIGVKYCSSSPGQNGKMKVESYVSEQYADLVAQAARY